MPADCAQAEALALGSELRLNLLCAELLGALVHAGVLEQQCADEFPTALAAGEGSTVARGHGAPRRTRCSAPRAALCRGVSGCRHGENAAQ